MKRFHITAIFILLCAAFLLYSYNSGYGYDAVEYLVIGRSLLDGYDLFHFSPSKSPGIFYLVAGFLYLWPDAGHVAISVLITSIFAAVVAFTFLFVGRTHGRTAAVISAAIVAASCFFMEMNFLETEALVFLCALPALPALRSGLRTRRLYPFLLAGCWIGCAIFFKTVGLFYAVGAAAFIAFWNRFKNRLPFSATVSQVLACGAGIVMCAPILLYAFTGQLRDYVHWTYIFPLMHYPSDTFFLGKLYTKLGWFFLLLLLTFALSFHRRVRSVLQMSCYPGIALTLGLAALLALFKNQASHYVFPAAGFLAIFMGIVISAAFSASPFMKRSAASFLVLAALAVPASVALYRPSALKRFIKIADYSAESEAGMRIREIVGENDRALFFSHPVLYWASHRYPNIPYINFHVHFSQGLRSDPDMLRRALEDPALVLVEFDPGYPQIRDPRFLDDPQLAGALGEFTEQLRATFEPVDIGVPKHRFWRRKNGRG